MQKLAKFVTMIFGLFAMVNGHATPSTIDEVPRTYALQDVRISLSLQTSRNIPGGYQIVITGDGQASYVGKKGTAHETIRKSMTDEQLVGLVNQFYEAHFLEFPNAFLTKKKVFLNSDKMLVTTLTKLVDVSSYRLSLKLGAFEKSVTVVDSQPHELAKLAKQIEAIFLT